MKLSQVQERIPYWYGKTLADPEHPLCVYLRSAPGRGKTTVLSEAPKQLGQRFGLNMGLVIINGPLLTPADSIGYLMPKHHEDFTESVFSSPFWWRTSEGKRLEEYDGGIIVVDEADKMDTDVKKVIGEAALSGRLGPHRLPKGWVVWMAGNRQGDRSGSTKELDHLINRRLEIDITDDLDSLLDWMDKNSVSHITKAFTKQHPGIVFTDGVPEKQGPWCTPRSLVNADKYLQVLADDRGGAFPEDPITVQEITGMIGPGAATTLFNFIRLDREMPPFEKIVADPKKAKVPEKPDAQMLVCYNLAHRVTAENAAPVITYVERMPKEFSVTFVSAAAKRDARIVTAPAVNKWCMENSSLMAAISAFTKKN